MSQRDEVGRSTRPPITKGKATDPQTQRRPCQPGISASLIENMRTEPLIEITAYDIYDDEDCGCENCSTPWGTEVLTSTRVVQVGGVWPKGSPSENK